MSDAPSISRVLDRVAEGATAEAVAGLSAYESADVEARRDAVQALSRAAEDDAGAVAPLVDALTAFLTDDERSVRLTTAKTLVAVAEADPEAVEDAVPALAARLADEGEFYYVRARAAEALGYVALAAPEAVSPGVLADFRVGLEFDEREVREQLAKALEHVALGDPERLRHRVSSLAAHLDDGADRVRYHLCSAFVVVGCASPDALADARGALVERLDDERAHVRGRAAEALGVLARDAGESVPRERLKALGDADGEFLAERAAFALNADAGGAGEAGGVGTVAGVRETTAAAVEAMTAPDDEHACQHCGLALPERGPPVCPRCGAPNGPV
ncbi:HEAT repeat domain-containing protein [Halocalculus aciditolerans]|uniref:HEAT repeat domain-containing protein n=1 Tax=Halocalculus aciditolerans TaxID=1383812 RepID=A0A830FKF9_9EURY|nr:HEAT repeat domain-containing protein [Halocalculus aciditolerans]GGL65049.1 hypothetical protein GCM10009039_23770 [Halocalculus aciditolerans]